MRLIARIAGMDLEDAAQRALNNQEEYDSLREEYKRAQEENIHESLQGNEPDWSKVQTLDERIQRMRIKAELEVEDTAIKMIEVLLDHGTKIDKSYHLLDGPALHGNTKLAKFLIESGVDPNWPAEGWPPLPPLYLALHWGNEDVAQTLLEHGAKACDFDIFCPYPLNWQFNWICRKGFGGIGIYYDWSRPGFHVDLRDPENTQHWTRSVIDGRVQYRFFIF